MTPTYHDSSSKPQASSSSSLSTHVFTYPIQDQGGFYRREVHQLNYQLEANNFASQGGSNEHQTPSIETDHHASRFTLWKKENGSHENLISDLNGSAAAEWMPSKKRLILRMMKSKMNPSDIEAPTNVAQVIKFDDQKLQSSSSTLETDDQNGSNNSTSSSNSNNPVRVCSDCNTTKTPLWRGGPGGPKSLCNACGIRQRKARRAMAAAAAAANGTVFAAETSPAVIIKTKVQNKDHKRSNSKGRHIAKFKKRSKIATSKNTSHGRKKKLCFEDFLISLSKNLAFHTVFPQDEKEAAILLMALSFGLVHG